MEQKKTNDHLSNISTAWSAVQQAHSSEEDSARFVRTMLLQRYRGAVHRYLLGGVRNADVAEELSQEFALRFIRGDFRRADPERGRFRDYLKTALVHLISDYRRKEQRWPQQSLSERLEPAAPPIESADEDREFLTCWRQEVLERTWHALAGCNSTYHTVLRLSFENDDLTSTQMAEQLTIRLKKKVAAEWVRQSLHRAREKFAKLLIDEVSSLLKQPTAEMLREELQELDLVRYCRSALQQQEGEMKHIGA